MLVDVTFDGVSLVKGATARPDGSGWFVELEQPMPVGTLLQVSGEAQATVRVERVTEGVGAGMLLLPAGAVAGARSGAENPGAENPGAEKKAEKSDPAPAAVAAGAPVAAPAAEAKKSDGDGDDEPEGGQPKNGTGAGKDRRKKVRKTVMGH